MLRSFLARSPSPAAARVARPPMSTSPSASAAKATVSVEYAKSGRSTCKGCSASIAKGALRLGASAHDPRGYDGTKWYHVACFPASSHPLGPVEKVKGFDSIKDHDREELRELEKGDGSAVGPLEEPSPKKRKVHNHKGDGIAVGPLEEPSPKKRKVHRSSPATGVAEEASISVEYAKSGRSTCKGCSENIASGALRLGASVRDPRGFDSSKWYHVACFPASSYPVFRVENVKGFDSIENSDREELRKLEENHKTDGNAADQLNEPNLKEEMVIF